MWVELLRSVEFFEGVCCDIVDWFVRSSLVVTELCEGAGLGKNEGDICFKFEARSYTSLVGDRSFRCPSLICCSIGESSSSWAVSCGNSGSTIYLGGPGELISIKYGYLSAFESIEPTLFRAG